MSTKAAVYLRVSTDRQTTANQRPEVEQLVAARGFEVVRVYEEEGSAAKKRPVFDRMIKAARRGEFSVLVIWAIDRFGRSMVGNLQDLLDLDRVGISVVSVKESWMDTAGPVRSLLIAIFSWAAEQERLRLVERTRAGLERARHRGAKLGRPRVRVDLDRVAELRDDGMSVREVAKTMGITYGTARRAIVRLEGGSESPPSATPKTAGITASPEP